MVIDWILILSFKTNMDFTDPPTSLKRKKTFVIQELTKFTTQLFASCLLAAEHSHFKQPPLSKIQQAKWRIWVLFPLLLPWWEVRELVKQLQIFPQTLWHQQFSQQAVPAHLQDHQRSAGCTWGPDAGPDVVVVLLLQSLTFSLIIIPTPLLLSS